MNPMLQAALSSILRWALTLGAGYLVKAGIWTQSETETYVAAGVVALLTIGWSLWDKYHTRLKILTALDSPQGTTEAAVSARVKTGDTPPVSTPKDVPPSVTIIEKELSK